MNWDIEAPNVVTEARFRELVESNTGPATQIRRTIACNGSRRVNLGFLKPVISLIADTGRD